MIDEGLSIWTIYDRPKGFPENYVARRFEATGEDTLQATDDIFVALDLEPLRKLLANKGLVRLPPCNGDDALIVDLWL